MFQTVAALREAVRGELGFRELLWGIQCRHPTLLALKDIIVPPLRRTFRCPHHHDFLALRLLTEPGLCVDVGANLGQSIDAFRIAFGRVPIVAFEPNPHLSRKISARFRFDPDVRVIAKGISDREATSMLYVPVYNGRPIHALGSIIESAAADWLKNARIPGVRHESTRCERVCCQIDTLDSFGLTPKVVKIDVQGAELEVLRGARKTLLHDRPIVMLESAKADVRAALNSASYRILKNLANGRFCEAAPGVNDVIAVPEENANAMSLTAHAVVGQSS